MKKICGYVLFAVMLLALVANAALAQNGTIKGVVTDDQTGATLPGATVLVEKTAYGAATDMDGKYVIANIPPGSYSLLVRFIGYTPVRQLITIGAGEEQAVDFKLTASSIQVNPVVVTAIGTQAERDQMGTSVSSVDAAELVTAGAHDIISDLEAKAPGVNTTETTGSPGAATRIVLRGAHSIFGDNQPLIVVDGVPMITTTWGTQQGYETGSGVDAMSRIDDINPDDIESIQIYSGPSSAGLWGAKAASGVIVITTKKGTKSGLTSNKKMSVSIYSTMTIDDLEREQPLQTTFGQGRGGKYIFGNKFSWGDMISKRSRKADSLSNPLNPFSTVIQKNSQQTYNHASELYQSPVSWENSVKIQGGDEWGDFLLDLNSLDQRGIVVANQDYIRNSVKADVSRRFSEGLTVRVDANYINSTSDRIQGGNNVSGIALGGYRTPPDFNNQPYLINFIDPITGAVTPNSQRTYRNPTGDPTAVPYYDNPFFTIYQIPTKYNVNRLIGNVLFSYDAAKWLNISWRTGEDYYTETRSTTYPVNDASNPTGFLSREWISESWVNSDLFATAKQKLTDDIEGSLLVGFHVDDNELNELYAEGTGFVLADAPSYLKNTTNQSTNEQDNIDRTAAFYEELNLNLYEQVFLKASGRTEAASTYGSDVKKTYFYPSASAAWQFTQLQDLKNDILSYGKARLAYGTAAVQPPLYSTSNYDYDAQYANGWQSGLYYLDGQAYNGGVVAGTILGNPNLKPEMTTEIEYGLDLRFFNDRLALNVTEYSNKSTDVILPLALPPSTGFSSQFVNGASMKNNGTEIQLIGDWLHIGAFSWSTTINWAKNNNTVTSLSGVEHYDFNGLGGITSSALLNEPLGVLYGTMWNRNADGSLALTNGFPTNSPQQGVIGNPNPDWRAGIINTFKYERLALKVVFDIKKGGQVYNGTKGALMGFGTDGSESFWTTLSSSDAAVLKSINGQTAAYNAAHGNYGYQQNADGTVSFRGYVNNFGGGNVLLDEGWFSSASTYGLGNIFNGPSEQFVEDGSFVRLKEVTLSYTLPISFIGMQSATLSLTGRNLALWTKYSGVDPEVSSFGNGNAQGIDYFSNPATKSYVISLRFDY
jgi:TonB-linked SusC/RagA family outer membrane protein